MRILPLWLKADAGVTKNASNQVSQWDDQSGNGNHASQGTLSDQPVWVDNATNGRPVLRFDGVSVIPGNYLTLGSNYLFSTNDGITLFAVCRSNITTGSDSDFVFDFGANAPANYGLVYRSNGVKFLTATAWGGTAVSYTLAKTTSEYSIVTGLAPSKKYLWMVF